MKICFTGDLFLGGDLLNKDATNIINVISFKNSDRRIVNLEQAISDSDYIENKCTLFTGSSSINQLKELKIDAVNIANNHIQDKGIEGINETREHLLNNEIGVFGAGKNLADSKTKFLLDENLVLFGYCDHNKKYLNQIKVATINGPGVNPLRYDNILDDLNKLDVEEKAILYFHWGKEHVFLPTKEDIILSKKLLKHPKVLLILGMHAHRVQGFVKYKSKKAYMSLGNFLFPNFYISPPTQIFYPKDALKNIDVTKLYHRVFNLTYKKWKWINRVSLVIEYDTINNTTKHIPVIQSEDSPLVNELIGFNKTLINLLVILLSLLYRLNIKVYHPLEKIHSNLLSKKWIISVYFFKVRQLGLKKTLLMLLNRIKNVN